MNITLNLNPDGSVSWSQANPTPISDPPKPIPQPVPQPPPQPAPPPYVPPPPAGVSYFDWAAAGFKEQMVVPGYGNPVIGPGDAGGCVRFIADSVSYPKGVIFLIANTTEPINPQDYCISSTPNDFTNYVPGSLRQGMGSSTQLGARFGSGTVLGDGDCMLVAGQTYYINFREYSPPRGTAHAVFQFSSRTD